VIVLIFEYCPVGFSKSSLKSLNFLIFELQYPAGKKHLKMIERSKLRKKKMQFVVADIYMPHNWMKF